MKLIYRLGVRLYAFAVRIASLWNDKAKAWMKGRKEVWEQLQNWQRKDFPVYWFHCASLGEFEQGRPLMEKLKTSQPCQIVVTFFSPSGYEIRKNYAGADLVIYLPRETVSNVRRFFDLVEPSIAFFIKYEFWATYIFEAKKRGVKCYSVAAVFHKKQLFFKPYGGYMRKVLHAFDAIFVQDEASKRQLRKLEVDSILAGDSRYDRVMENAARVEHYEQIEAFIGGEKVLVIGSSWAEDEEVVFNFLKRDFFTWKVIIAPHEIHSSRIDTIESTIGLKSIRYSNLSPTVDKTIRVLIIDNIGMLMNVYQYAEIAYVGGAFGNGLHNILEPAAFGVPVIFGNRYAKFNEAYDFIAHQIGFSISTTDEFAAVFQELLLVDRSADVISFMQAKTGATNTILEYIKA